MASAERQSRQNAAEKDPQHAVPSGQFRAFCRRPLKHADWMAQSQVLEFEGSARAEDSTHSGEECREKNEHRRKVYESSINGSRSDISRFSRATSTSPFGSSTASWPSRGTVMLPVTAHLRVEG